MTQSIHTTTAPDAAEQAVRACLLSHPPIVDLVGQRIAINAADESWPDPYIVYRCSHERDWGMSGALLADIVTIDIQCWAKRAAPALAIGAQVEIALHSLLDADVTETSAGFDEATGLDYAAVTAILILTPDVPEQITPA